MFRGHRKTDQLFAEFCRSGDPAALGAVFDRTAAELLHIAVWLCGDRTDAEDLLQRTFVQAIEARQQFEPGRPVLPWLCGILGNHARHLRRERARVLPARAAAAERDPALRASEAEFAAAVRRRVQAIEAPYREVLELHLEQGLNSKQIAEQLHRPAGTVRTQLVRALELLRRKLPNGFVAGVALISLPDAARLAAVKHAVMATAKAAACAATTGVLVPAGVLMSKKMLFAVVLSLLLLGSGAYVLLLADGQQALAVVAAVDAPAAAPTAEPTPIAVQRTELVAPSRTAAPPATGRLIVHVQWDSLAPASAMPVFLSFAIASAPLLDRLQATTDTRGQCTFESLRPGTWWIQPLVGAPVQAQIEAAATADVVVTAKALATLRGKVVDEQQQPVADAEIWATGPDQVHDAAIAAHSDTDGAFELPVSRAVFVGARQRGRAPSNMVFFFPQSKHNDVTLRLRSAEARVRGVVQDAAGKPVAGAHLRVGAVSISMLSGYNPDMESDSRGVDVISDARGRFAVDDLPSGSMPINAWAEGFAASREWLRLAPHATAECKLVLKPGASVRGVVRDADGSPIADALVGYGGDYDFDRVLARSDADGAYELRGLPASTVSLFARDDSHRSASHRLYLRADQPAIWNPRLAPSGEIAGRVLDASGRPCVAVRIACGNSNEPVVSAESDAEGCFHLTGLGTGPHDLGIWIHQTLVRTVRQVEIDNRDLQIQLTADEMPSAHLRLCTVDADGRGRGGVLRVTHGDGGGLPGDESASGKFDIGPLLPGTLSLSLECGEAGSDWTFPLTTVTVAADETRDLGEFFVPEPGRVQARMVDGEGKELRIQSCTLYTLDGYRVARFDATEGAAPAGRWLLLVHASDYARRTTPDGSALVDVMAGRTTEATVTAHTGSSAVFALSSTDPQVNGTARLLVRDAAGTLVTVADAWLPRQSGLGAHELAPGRYRVEAFGPGRRRGELTFDLADGERTILIVPVH